MEIPNIWIFKAHPMLGVLIDRFLFTKTPVFQLKSWNDIKKRLLHQKDDQVTMFVRWHDEIMMQLPIFIRNMDNEKFFNPERQDGLFCLLLSIKELTKVAKAVVPCILDDETDEGTELRNFIDKLNTNNKLQEALNSDLCLISAERLMQYIKKPNND